MPHPDLSGADPLGALFHEINVNQVELSDIEFLEILRLSRLYDREARKCQKAKAFLAGCVLIGAAFETLLLAFVNCYTEEACASPLVPRKHRRVKPFNTWTLSQLLAVVKERGWLPSKLSLQEEWNTSKAQIGDYGEIVRQMRNLIHPARYASDFSGKRVTTRYLESLFEILHSAVNHLMSKIGPDLQQAVERVQKGA